MVFRGDADERRNWPGAATRAPRRGALSEAGKLRRAALKKRVEGGEKVGLLAYDGDEPVGWVSVAPRPSFERLKGPHDFTDAPQKVWSVVCFYLKRAYRGAGHGNAMMMIGGGIRGGRVYGQWPGLAREQRYEGRDLAVTTDFRTVFAEVVRGHLGLTDLSGVFPGFQSTARLGLFG